jgi:hypothetical protein
VLRPDETTLLSHAGLNPQSIATLQTAFGQRAVLLDNESGNSVSAGTTGTGAGSVLPYLVPVNPASGLFIAAVPVVIFSQIAKVTVSNSAAETTILTAAPSIAAAALLAGSVIRIRFSGLYSTAVAAPTLTVKIKLGGVVVASSAISNLLASASALSFEGEALVTCWTTGAGGTVQGGGNVQYTAVSATGARNFGDLNNAGATAAANTTIANTLDVTVQFGTANVSNIVAINTALIELAQ